MPKAEVYYAPVSIHRSALLDSYIFLKGLMHLWLSDRDNSIVRTQVRSLIEAYIALCRTEMRFSKFGMVIGVLLLRIMYIMLNNIFRVN